MSDDTSLVTSAPAVDPAAAPAPSDPNTSAAAPAAAPGTPPAADPAAAPAAPATQPAAAAPAAPVVPEKYEFKMPEGVELDTAMAEQFSGIAKELGLTQEQAQKFADLHASNVTKQIAQHNQTVQGWRDEVTKDAVLGGDNLKASAAVAGKAIDLAPAEIRQELRTLLDSTGMGNHPLLFKWAHAIGKLVAEDGHIQAAPKPVEKKPFYNNSNMVRD